MSRQINPILKKQIHEKSFGIHWFRRDLRIAGNPALQWSRIKFNGRVVGLFCFDSKFITYKIRFAFFSVISDSNVIYDLNFGLKSHISYIFELPELFVHFI